MGKSDGGVGLASGLDDRTRDACLHELGDHYAAGRMTAEELDSRIQAALAAETEAELTAVMADLDLDDDRGRAGAAVERRSRRDALTTSAVVRWAAGLVVVAAGSALLAVLSPGPAAAELAVGLAAGVLGFSTHWWLTRRPADPAPTSGAPQAAKERPAAARPQPPVLRDEAWHPDDSDEAAIEAVSQPDHSARLRAIRPQGRGNGGIPSQRSGG